MLDYRILQNKQLRVKVPTNDIPAIRVMGQRCLEFYREGKLDLQSLVTDVIGMEKIPQALHLVQEKPDEHIKIIIDMERSTE
jgi:threonine dehydrogenase-like Zn-dependent dehydrogenase